MMVSTTSASWHACELVLAVFELVARLEHDDAAHENVRLVDHAFALQQIGDVADAEPARNVDHLVFGERARGIEPLLAEQQRGADRNRNHDESVKIALPTTTIGWRARRERRLGIGTRSGSSAARGLRGGLPALRCSRCHVADWRQS